MDTYRIYSGSEEVTNVTGYPLEDEDEAKRLAQEISAGQPGSTVTVNSVSSQPAGGWTRTVATYIDGKPRPWVWKVTFLGPMPNLDDNLRLNEKGISYMGGHSEPMPGGVRAGLSRHELAVEAESGDEAVQKVRDALGGQAFQYSNWTHEPGDDESVRYRLEDQAGE
ncbi:MAG: hypothetical protein WEB79_00235 [Thermoleophilaceae bacterium]